MARMSGCRAVLPLPVLVDYWLGELPAPAAAAAEEHLMGCGACSARAERLARLGTAVPALVRRGGLPLALTPSLLARLERDGVRIRRHRVEPGAATRCTARPDDDLIALVLPGDFRPGERVDLVWVEAPPGLPPRVEDLPVDAERGEVVVVDPAEVIRALPADVAVLRLEGVGPAGTRTIGEYTLVHTPWPGGA